MSRSGKLLYQFWHRPIAAVRRSIREGGPIEQLADARGAKLMQEAARKLQAQTDAPPHYKVNFLTGARFWFQTAFCFYSLRRTSKLALCPIFYDDETLTDTDSVFRAFPDAEIVTAAQIHERLDANLPEKDFPTLRRHRETYKHLRKLTDIHAGNPGWNLVLDSDMLFFRRPTALESWMLNPDRPCLMRDVHNAYGYTDLDLQTLNETPVPQKLNVGVCGLNLQSSDWPRLEDWTARLLRDHGSSYYLEQALVALLIAGDDSLLLPSEDYKLMPSIPECLFPTAALHHYVDLSKRGYFRHAWRKILSDSDLPRQDSSQG